MEHLLVELMKLKRRMIGGRREESSLINAAAAFGVWIHFYRRITGGLLNSEESVCAGQETNSMLDHQCEVLNYYWNTWPTDIYLCDSWLWMWFNPLTLPRSLSQNYHQDHLRFLGAKQIKRNCSFQVVIIIIKSHLSSFKGQCVSSLQTLWSTILRAFVRTPIIIHSGENEMKNNVHHWVQEFINVFYNMKRTRVGVRLSANKWMLR